MQHAKRSGKQQATDGGRCVCVRARVSSGLSAAKRHGLEVRAVDVVKARQERRVVVQPAFLRVHQLSVLRFVAQYGLSQRRMASLIVGVVE
jgi:hypothetical protein